MVLKGVLGGEPFEMKYDKLIVAVGARNNTFNIPGVTEHAYFLKELKHVCFIFVIHSSSSFFSSYEWNFN